jgi:hypothetical protein
MEFISFDLGQLRGGQVVEVTLSGSAANVLLLDSSNFSAFKNGRQHRYYGGLTRRTPVHLGVPYLGHWHAVVYVAGPRGNVRAAAQVL